ncbi:pyridoxamine 5'-phosphate oxidase family protein [Peribacillus sp. SCS-37]|uniref:pyridoxamine 5'-phosphate oxidase family protein n=1 Tax=Paraperibacillus esterisolvens TaxID=3115296 RepID=UPI003906342E
MNQEELKSKVMELLENNKIGTLATVQDGRPHSRYMTFFNEDLTLYTPTSKETSKTDEIENNPYVHILLGYNGEGYGDAYLEIEGKASVSSKESLKDELWKENFENWFDGKDDPDYVVLEIKPESVRLMNIKDKDPQTLKL